MLPWKVIFHGNTSGLPPAGKEVQTSMFAYQVSVADLDHSPVQFGVINYCCLACGDASMFIWWISSSSVLLLLFARKRFYWRWCIRCVKLLFHRWTILRSWSLLGSAAVRITLYVLKKFWKFLGFCLKSFSNSWGNSHSTCVLLDI